jgi:hypothetical protein
MRPAVSAVIVILLFAIARQHNRTRLNHLKSHYLRESLVGYERKAREFLYARRKGRSETCPFRPMIRTCFRPRPAIRINLYVRPSECLLACRRYQLDAEALLRGRERALAYLSNFAASSDPFVALPAL